MPDGATFDLILAAVLVLLALWEGAVALRMKERRRLTVVVLSLVAAAVLVALRGPAWWSGRGDDAAGRPHPSQLAPAHHADRPGPTESEAPRP